VLPLALVTLAAATPAWSPDVRAASTFAAGRPDPPGCCAASLPHRRMPGGLSARARQDSNCDLALRRQVG
jgi:hypothetical protein